MINYFAKEKRPSRINLAIARITLVVAMIWKVLIYQWGVYTEWPAPVLSIETLPMFGEPPLVNYAGVISVACILSLLCVLVGYRIRLTCCISSILLAYLGAIRLHWWHSHQTELLFVGSLLLLLFAIFPEEHQYSIDQLRRREPLEKNQLRHPSQLISELRDTGAGQFQHRSLKWGLIVIGLHYFGGGFSKLIVGNPIKWIQPENLGRYILFRDSAVWSLDEILFQYPVLLTIGATFSIVIEFTFLPCIILRRQIWPFFILLTGFHTAVLLLLGPNFFDLLLLLCLFLPWDTLYFRIRAIITEGTTYDFR